MGLGRSGPEGQERVTTLLPERARFPWTVARPATTANRPAEPTPFTPQRAIWKLFIDPNCTEAIVSAVAVETGMRRKLGLEGTTEAGEGG